MRHQLIQLALWEPPAWSNAGRVHSGAPLYGGLCVLLALSVGAEPSSEQTRVLVQQLDEWTNKEDRVMSCQTLGIPRQGAARRIFQTANDITLIQVRNSPWLHLPESGRDTMAATSRFSPTARHPGGRDRD